MTWRGGPQGSPRSFRLVMPASARSLPPVRSRTAGFTLVELVLAIVILGVLAVVGSSRFFSRDTFDAAGFREQLTAAARYAQQLAIATQCRTRLVVNQTAGSYAVQIEDDAATAAPCDGGFRNARRPVVTDVADAQLQDSRAGAITGGGDHAVVFDAFGRPDAGAQIQFGPRTLSIEAGTGYVHLE